MKSLLLAVSFLLLSSSAAAQVEIRNPGRADNIFSPGDLAFAPLSVSPVTVWGNWASPPYSLEGVRVYVGNQPARISFVGPTGLGFFLPEEPVAAATVLRVSLARRRLSQLEVRIETPGVSYVSIINVTTASPSFHGNNEGGLGGLSVTNNYAVGPFDGRSIYCPEGRTTGLMLIASGLFLDARDTQTAILRLGEHEIRARVYPFAGVYGSQTVNFNIPREIPAGRYSLSLESRGVSSPVYQLEIVR